MVLLLVLVSLGAVVGAPGTATPAGALAGDAGEESQAYVEGSLATVTMSQSKVWFHAGSWFAAMLRTGPPSSGGSPDADVAVFKRTGGAWVPTGTTIDVRGTTKQDVVAVGDTVYVASHKKLDNETSVPETNPSNMTRMAKLVYDSATGQYAMAAGFPVVMNAFQMEAITIDVDSTGAVWAAWVQADQVLWQRSTDGGATWSAPTALHHGHAHPTADDIAAVVTYGTRVGIMWASQVGADDGYWFVSTAAGAGAPAWSFEEAAFTGAGLGDDHISIKDVGGQLVAAVKTRSGTASSNPGVVLLRRSTSGVWTNTPAWVASTRATRPVVTSDGTNVTVSATLPGTGGGQGVFAKVTTLATPGFDTAAKGTAIMMRPTTGDINDASSTKDLFTPASGSMVIASDTTTQHYWTSQVAGAPAVTPPSAPGPVTAVAGPGRVTLTFGAATPGSAPITGYRITATPALAAAIDVPASAAGKPQVVAAPNGVARTFQVQALAGATAGPTATSASVTPANHLPFASADAFIARQAQDFLGRAPTAQELAQARSQLGTSPGASVVLGPLFLGSPGVGGEDLRGPQASVARLYLAYYLRPPDVGGFDFWLGWLSSGRSLEQVSQQFASLQEFRNRYGSLSDSQYVDLVYRNLFDRTPDAGGKAYWLDRLAKGMTRGRMMTNFSELSEFRHASANRVVVCLAQRWMLGRMPTNAEMLAEAAKGQAPAVEAVLFGSAYRSRVGL